MSHDKFIYFERKLAYCTIFVIPKHDPLLLIEKHTFDVYKHIRQMLSSGPTVLIMTHLNIRVRAQPNSIQLLLSFEKKNCIFDTS